MLVKIVRDLIQPSACTYGRLILPNAPILQSIELPWHPSTQGPSGEPDISCIGIGTYRLEPRLTEARGWHWRIVNEELGIFRVPNDVPLGHLAHIKYRSLILLHVANYPHELRGCIAPGLDRGVVDDEPCISQSRKAFNYLLGQLGTEITHTLEISVAE